MKNKLLKLLLVYLIIFNTLYPGAGITPYAKLDGEIYFLLSVEKKCENQEQFICITDLGGAGPTDIHTAAKEGYEETLGIFSTNNIYNLKKEKSLGIQYFENILHTQKPLALRNKEYKTFFIDITNKVITKEAIINALEHRLIQLRTEKIFKKNFGVYKEKRGYLWIARKDFINMIENPQTCLYKAKFYTSFLPQTRYIYLTLKLYRPFLDILKKDNYYLKLYNL